MSLTIVQARLNVRINLGDLDDSAYAIDNERLTRVLVRQAQLHNTLAGVSDNWIVAALTVSDTGSPDFTFTGSLQYDSVQELRRASDGFLLKRSTRDAIEAMRATTTPGTGAPEAFYLFETTGPVLKARLHPRPVAADTIDALVQSIAGATYTDATVIDGSEYLLRAIELATAMEAMARITQGERERIKLSPEVAASWKSDRDTLVGLERERKNRLRAPSHIPAQVN